jgi:hypothetical protein
MAYLDAALLRLIERFCRRFQRLTGRTNVWLAFQLTNLSIVVYFIWAGLYFVRVPGTLKAVIAVICAGVLYLLSQTVFRVPVESYEASAYQRVAKGVRNPRQLRDTLLRIPFLTLSLVLPYPGMLLYRELPLPLIPLSYSLIVLTTIVLYLLACDPLQPARARAEERVRGMMPASPERSPGTP